MQRIAAAPAAWLLPGGVLLTIVPLAFVPAPLHPLVYGLSALFAGIVLASVALALRRFGGSAATLVVVAAAPVAVLAVSSLLAPSPQVSLFGIYGQHSGWILYAALYLWLVASLALASPRSLRATTVAGAVLGAACSAAAVLEKLGVFSWGSRYSPSPSGFLDNPISLGQVLVVALGCSVAWWLMARSGRTKVAAAVCGVLAVAGLATGGVLGTALAAVIGVIVSVALWRARVPSGQAASTGASAIVAALVAVMALTWALSSPSVPAATAARLSQLSNMRTDIWASTWRVVAERPVLGRGADQFGVWQSWTGSPNGDLIGSTTLDPHNSLLAILVAGGVLGLAAALSLVWFVARAVLSAHARSPLPPAALALVGAMAGLAASTLLAWIYLPAAVLGLALLGCVLGIAGRTDPAEEAAPDPRIVSAAPWVAGVVTAVSAALLVWLAIAAVPTEAAYGWQTRLGTGTGYPPADAVVAYRRWPDPEYATTGLDGYFAQIVNGDTGIDAEALDLVAATIGTGRHDARTAFSRIKVVQAVAATSGRDLYSIFLAAAAVGRQADPSSGFWDYAVVIESLRLKRTADAARYARAALAFPQTAENTAWLRDVVAGTGKLQTQ